MLFEKPHFLRPAKRIGRDCSIIIVRVRRNRTIREEGESENHRECRSQKNIF